MGAAGDGARLPRVRGHWSAARSHRPRSDRTPRLRDRPAHRHDLHDARRDLRRPSRCRDDVHRAVHDLRRHPRAQWRGTILRGLDHRRDRPIGKGRRPGTNRHCCWLSAGRGLRQRRRQHRDARRSDVAADEARGLSRRHGGRSPRRGRDRRDPRATGDGSCGVSHRRVPAHLLSRSDRHGGDPGGSLLPVHFSDGRSSTRAGSAFVRSTPIFPRSAC